MDPEAPPGQPELPDHQGMQEADQVGARADQVPGVGEGLLEGARPTEPLALLEHEHRAAGPGQVGGRGQAVVAAADDHGVPATAGQLVHPGGPADPAEHAGDRAARQGGVPGVLTRPAS